MAYNDSTSPDQCGWGWNYPGTRNQADKEPLSGCATSKLSLNYCFFLEWLLCKLCEYIDQNGTCFFLCNHHTVLKLWVHIGETWCCTNSKQASSQSAPCEKVLWHSYDVYGIWPTLIKIIVIIIIEDQQACSLQYAVSIDFFKKILIRKICSKIKICLIFLFKIFLSLLRPSLFGLNLSGIVCIWAQPHHKIIIWFQTLSFYSSWSLIGRHVGTHSFPNQPTL